jgi:hypothetical protein
MPRGKRAGTTSSTKKEFTVADHVELFSFFADENGNHTMGMFRGLPIWVSWFVTKGCDGTTEEGDTYYETTEQERTSFPSLANVPLVVLRSKNMRQERRGFQTFVVVPEGVSDPDYEAFHREWENYLASLPGEKAPRRHKKVRGEKLTSVVEQPVVNDEQSKVGLDHVQSSVENID